MRDSDRASAASVAETWPDLPLEAWEDTKNTLHLFVQIVGKIRLRYSAKINHWWHVPLYVSARGMTTTPIPYGDRTFEMEFDLHDHHLYIRVSDGAERRLPLESRSVADFYHDVMGTLESLAIPVRILAKPYGVPMNEPFPTDTVHAAYDPEYVSRFWRILSHSDTVFKAFRARFIGKCSPVHVFWHSFDLAVTRFSGRRAPERQGADPVTREAYSHEVISCGFWAGDQNVRAPAYYAYVAPEPPGLAAEPLRPSQASWKDQYGSSMAMLMYDDLRKSNSPADVLMEFLQSAYEAGAKRANWDRNALERI